jgi:hypothetical protein
LARSPEGTAGWAQLLGNSLEIAGNSIRRRPGSSNRRLDLLGGALEELPAASTAICSLLAASA